MLNKNSLRLNVPQTKIERTTITVQLELHYDNKYIYYKLGYFTSFYLYPAYNKISREKESVKKSFPHFLAFVILRIERGGTERCSLFCLPERGK